MLVGVLTGLVPGIHVNTVVALMLASSATLGAAGFDYSVLIAFTCALAISHTFFDVIPGLFLGVPGDSAFVHLPGHRMVRRGLGERTIKLSIYGSTIGLLLGAGVLALLLSSWGSGFIISLEKLLSKWMLWVLLLLSALLLLSDGNRLRALLAFLFSGALGIVVLGSPLVPGGSSAPINALFPALAGLFGVAGLVYAIGTAHSDEAEETDATGVGATDSPRVPIVGPSLRGGLGGLIVGLLPGLGSANAATLLLLIEDKLGARKPAEVEDQTYLVTVSSLNTSEALFSVAALYLISKTRSGASIAVDQLIGGGINGWDVASISLAMVAGGVLAGLLLWRIGPLLAQRMYRLNDVALNWAVILFLTLLVYFLLGSGGLTILVSATAIGVIPLLWGVRRAQLMGFFLVPTVLFHSGLQPALAELLGVQARVSPSFEALAIQKLALAIAVAVGVGVFAYFLAQRLQRWLGGYRGAILFLAPLAMFALLQTGQQVLYPQDSSQLFDWGPSQDWIAGEIDRVVDGDTVYVASSGRRYYVRLAGIDSPELSQPDGAEASRFLERLVEDENIVWRPVGVDSHGRILGVLYLDDRDLNLHLVRSGNAWANSGPDSPPSLEYQTAQKQAKQEKTGLWNAPEAPTPPWAWRRR